MKSAFNKTMHVATFLSAMAFVGSASAVDGTVQFTGKLTDSTCNITNATASVTEVTLPTIATRNLDTAGKTDGLTPFSFSLEGCPSTETVVRSYFEPSSDVVDGKLVNTATANSNVQIQLLNGDSSAITLGVGVNEQNSKHTTISGGKATLNYLAQYYATGAAVKGDVKSSVRYTLVYQ